MENSDWWKDFFDDIIVDVTLTKNAEPVCKFISEFICADKDLKVFDQCCGKGFITNEFAKRGHFCLGIDASEKYIDFANENFSCGNCTFVLGDAKTFTAEEKFDIGINWNTSFAYDENDEENFKMIKSFADNLKTGAHFFIATFNPDYIKQNFQKFLNRDFEKDGKLFKCLKESFIENNMLKSYWHVTCPDGQKFTKFGQTKMYSVTELNEELLNHNLFIENVYENINFEKFSKNSGSMIIYGRKREIR